MSLVPVLAATIPDLLGAFVLVTAIGLLTHGLLLRAHGGPDARRVADRNATITRVYTIAAFLVIAIRVAELL